MLQYDCKNNIHFVRNMIQKPQQKKVTRTNPLSGALNFLRVLPNTLTDQPQRRNALTDEFAGIIIDTCCASDTNIWETGILREAIEDGWIIVSQYDSEDEAKREHQNWVAYLKENPDCELKDIDLWDLGLPPEKIKEN